MEQKTNSKKMLIILKKKDSARVFVFKVFNVYNSLGEKVGSHKMLMGNKEYLESIGSNYNISYERKTKKELNVLHLIGKFHEKAKHAGVFVYINPDSKGGS